MHSLHIVRTQDFGRQWIESTFQEAEAMAKLLHAGPSDLLRGRIMATLFYEPSTRTRMSFEAAMLRLGGSVISTDNAGVFSSAAKGETLEDTIRVVGAYADIIVLRHHEVGSSDRAASVSTRPIINAGDGTGQHPTQSLIDLYTIQQRFHRIDGVRVGFVGDLANGRTVHSLAYLLSKFEPGSMTFISHPDLAMPDKVLWHLDEHNVGYTVTNDLKAALPELDVLYVTRVQRERFERFEDYERVRNAYTIDRSVVAEMPRGACVMHPLPRLDELAPDVDHDPRAVYFPQAANGVPVRMALLKYLLT